jgi:DNA-binding NarL/FixJ family response regulator
VKNRAARKSQPDCGKYDVKEGTMSIRILIAEGRPVMRDTLRGLIAKVPGLEVVAETGDGLRAFELARELSPDIVVLDTHLLDVGGVEAARRIKTESPGVRIITFSIHSDRRFVAGMLKAGASGYLLKDCAFEELAQAIRIVMADGVYLSSGIAAIEGFAAPEAG